MLKNFILKTDGYKISHYLQYPPNTIQVGSYYESRGGQFQETVFFGLQYILKRHFLGSQITAKKIKYAKNFCKKYFQDDSIFNEEDWNYILKKHNGKLPLSIFAVPEGSVIPTNNVLMTVECSDPKAYWLTNYAETLLSQVWYSSTVATQSREMKKIILKYLNQTGNPDLIGYKLHDFGFRGVTSFEQSGIGGMAHLLNFRGTDTISGILFAQKFYNAGVIGHTIPAAEHSTITSWGKLREEHAYLNMLNKFKNGAVAVVSDSYNIFNACEYIWGEKLHDIVKSRNGTLIVRPDSGNPIEVLLKILPILGEKFGYILNDKGYKVLDSHIRVIQGDSISINSIGNILQALMDAGWSADNISFGSGGGLLQEISRDTSKYAFKCSFAITDQGFIEVYKDPITDPGKKSKKGKLGLIYENGAYNTVALTPGINNCLLKVFENGKLLIDYDYNSVIQKSCI